MKEDQYRYVGKRSTGSKACMIEMIPADERIPTVTFKAYPNWSQYTYTLCPVGIGKRWYKKRLISMDLVREYK